MSVPERPESEGRYWRPSFTIQLFLVLAVLEGGPVLLFGLWTGQVRQVEAEETFDRMAHQQAVATRDAVMAVVRQKEEVLSVVAGTVSTIEVWTADTLQSIADAQLAASGSFDAFMVADQTGRSVVIAPSVRIDGTPTTAGIDYSDRSYYGELMRTGETAFGSLAMGKQSMVPNIHLAVPVLHPGDAPSPERIRGLVAAGIRSELLQDVARRAVGVDGTMRVLIVDDQQRVVADTSSQLAPLSSIGELEGFEQGCDPSGRDRIDERGVLLRATCAPLRLGDQRWSVWVSAPRAVLDMDATRARDNSRHITLLILLFSLGFSAWASSRVGEWIQQMADLAGRVGEGDFDVTLPRTRWYYPQEAEQLSVMVRQTLLRLQAHDDRVQALVTELQALNRRLQPFADAWSEVHDAIEILSPAATVMFVNPAYSRLTSSDERVVGSPSSLVVPLHPEDDGVPGLLARAVLGEPWQVQLRVHVNGQRRIHDINLSPVLDGQGRLRRVVVVRRDITEVRHAQAAAAHNDRLAALGTMAAGLAHEINNPLTYIRMSLELVQEDQQAHPGETDEARELEQAIQDAIEGVERVSTIVRDMLGLARSGVGAAPVVHERVSLAQVVQTCVTMARAQLESGAHLTVEPATIPMALGQKSELIQVILNLIINAVQAMEARPKHQNLIEVRMGTEQGEVWVEVEDNGPGIPAADVERIFEPFYTSKPVGQGVGLGLAVSRSIVQRMGGRLSVTSGPDKGACFRVELAAAREARPAIKLVSKPDPQVDAGGGRVLVIDDNPRVARSIKRMLRRHRVTTVENGPAALKILSEESFDLIICDVMMPGMDGPTLYEHLREMREEQSRRLVFLTGAAKDSGVHAALNATGRRVLSKPTTLAELEALVREFTS